MVMMTYNMFVVLVTILSLLPDVRACGGCSGDPITDTVCVTNNRPGTVAGVGTGIGAGGSTIQVTRTRRVTCTRAYQCYVWVRFYGWMYRVRRTCYWAAYCTVTETVEVPVGPKPAPDPQPVPDRGIQGTHEHPCCDGYIQTSKDQCSRCGRSKYSSSPTPRGIITYIVGGQTARPNEYPWLTRMTTHYNSKYSSCGGTIIGKRWILTAAHCVYGGYLGSSFATVADHDQRDNIVGANEKRYTYSRIYTHPQYYPGNGVSNYDIALVKTTQDIAYNEDVQPACLPKEAKSYLGEEVTVAGWGRTSGWTTLQPTLLQHTTATVIDPGYCNLYRFLNIICAYGIRSNVCSGDSGGPMVHEAGGYMTVIGVTWWSIMGCPAGTQFGVTDVSQYIDWISNIIHG